MMMVIEGVMISLLKIVGNVGGCQPMGDENNNDNDGCVKT
jgi:hypothetical protein